ncbi:MAG: leucine-rich repeat domain-containing protein, partial [Treponemataceae bacterium]|nr:leucine-rich repeat domain-containing protein [Treponemataceae bacterium]
DETHHWHKASCNIENHNTNKAEHSWDNGIVTKEPTEEADGEKTFTCTVCQRTKTEAIPALGHNHTIDANWTSDETHHWHKASCNIENHNTNKAEHSWENKFTLTDEGKREEKCPICGYVKSSAWTQETLSELSNALKNYDGTEAKVKVAGTITYTDIAIIKEALNENTSKLVALELNETTGLKIFPAKAFYIDSSSSCKNLISVTIPNGVTEIGEYAFQNCTGLTSVTIPEGVTTIGSSDLFGGAFSGCTSLTSVTIPNSLTTIGNTTFKGCKSLTSITIPNKVTKIGWSAFDECTALTSITIPNSVTEI